MNAKQKAAKKIATRCKHMAKLFNECVKLADEAGVVFELPWGGEGTSPQDGYGAGATYYPEVEGYQSAHWTSSTANCNGW